MCAPTTFTLVDAIRDTRAVVARALRPHWVADCGVDAHLTPRVAELIWERRRDINPVVLLEAVTTIRTSGERLESVSPSRLLSLNQTVAAKATSTCRVSKQCLNLRVKKRTDTRAVPFLHLSEFPVPST